jgi:hypothetical protein
MQSLELLGDWRRCSILANRGLGNRRDEKRCAGNGQVLPH